MIAVFDSFEEKNRDLYFLLKEKLEDNGFKACVFNEPGTNEDFIDIYMTLIRGQDVDINIYHKLHEALLPLPDYWEIRLDNAVYDLGKKKAAIYCRDPIEKKIVRAVTWLNEKGKIVREDHYSHFGIKYKSYYCDENSYIKETAYFDNNDIECLNINHSNGIITVYENGYVTDVLTNIDALKYRVIEMISMRNERIVLTSEAQSNRFSSFETQNAVSLIVNK